MICSTYRYVSDKFESNIYEWNKTRNYLLIWTFLFRNFSRCRNFIIFWEIRYCFVAHVESKLYQFKFLKYSPRPFVASVKFLWKLEDNILSGKEMIIMLQIKTKEREFGHLSWKIYFLHWSSSNVVIENLDLLKRPQTVDVIHLWTPLPPSYEKD